jgi:hypothetical protein
MVCFIICRHANDRADGHFGCVAAERRGVSLARYDRRRGRDCPNGFTCGDSVNRI